MINNDLNLQASWVGNPPDEPDAVCECDWCGEPLYGSSEAYELDGDIVCEECAFDYLREHRIDLDERR